MQKEDSPLTQPFPPDVNQKLLQPEEWTIPIVSDEHGILQFGDPFEQNETTQEQSATDKSQQMDKLPLSACFYREVDVELSPLHVSQEHAMKTILTNQEIESLSADLSQPVYAFTRSAVVYQKIRNSEEHQQDVPSAQSRETAVMDAIMDSPGMDLGTLLCYGDLGPISVDDISIEALPSDTNMEPLLNETYKFGNTLMSNEDHQPNTSNPLAHRQSLASFPDSTKEEVSNVELDIARATFNGPACRHSSGSVWFNFGQNTDQSGNSKHSLANHSGQKPLQCDICPKQFSTSSSYQKHRRTHTGEKPLKYDICPKHFRTSNDYNMHRRTHTGGKPFQCDLCPKQFSKSCNYQTHRRTHTGEKPFQCDVCLKHFLTSGNYQRHRRTHTGEKPFQCDICLKQFLTSDNCQTHRRIHTGEKPFQYDVCLKQFATSSSCKRHRRRHTRKKPFQCDICPKQFGTSGSYQTHRRTHTGEKPFQCDVCLKQFLTSGNYQRHRRTHTGEKPFQCDICLKQFLTSGNYQRHRRTHTGEKPFQCDICLKQFLTSDNCQTHRRIHTGEKPFQCDVCLIQFVTSSSCKRHRRTHEKPYICCWCSQDYCLKSELIEHVGKCSSRNVSCAADPVVSFFVNTGTRRWTYMQ